MKTILVILGILVVAYVVINVATVGIIFWSWLI